MGKYTGSTQFRFSRLSKELYVPAILLQLNVMLHFHLLPTEDTEIKQIYNVNGEWQKIGRFVKVADQVRLVM